MESCFRRRTLFPTEPSLPIPRLVPMLLGPPLTQLFALCWIPAYISRLGEAQPIPYVPCCISLQIFRSALSPSATPSLDSVRVLHMPRLFLGPASSQDETVRCPEIQTRPRLMRSSTCDDICFSAMPKSMHPAPDPKRGGWRRVLARSHQQDLSLRRRMTGYG